MRSSDLVDDQHATRALQSAGVTADALLSEWGWVLLDADKPAEADRVFARLLKEYPDSPHAADARFNLAESANLAHNYAEVVRLLTPLAAIKPVEPKAEGHSNQPNVEERPLRLSVDSLCAAASGRTLSAGTDSGRAEGLGRCRCDARSLARGISRQSVPSRGTVSTRRVGPSEWGC